MICAADLLTGCSCVCVWVLSGAAELCLLSLLLLGEGLAVVEPLPVVCFWPLPPAHGVFPQRVLPQVTLRGLRKLFWLQLPVLLMRWSAVSWVCGAFGAALGVPPCAVLFFQGLRLWAASPAAGCPSGFLPFLTPYAWPTAVLVASVGLQPFPCVLSSPAPAGLLGFAGFFTLCQGAPMGVVTALWVTVWGYLMAPHASRALLLALSSPPAVLTLCECCALFTAWFPLP